MKRNEEIGNRRELTKEQMRRRRKVINFNFGLTITILSSELMHASLTPKHYAIIISMETMIIAASSSFICS